MTKSGIYLVQPAQSELKIIYNQKDAEGFIKLNALRLRIAGRKGRL